MYAAPPDHACCYPPNHPRTHPQLQMYVCLAQHLIILEFSKVGIANSPAASLHENMMGVFSIQS